MIPIALAGHTVCSCWQVSHWMQPLEICKRLRGTLESGSHRRASRRHSLGRVHWAQLFEADAVHVPYLWLLALKSNGSGNVSAGNSLQQNASYMKRSLILIIANVCLYVCVCVSVCVCVCVCAHEYLCRAQYRMRSRSQALIG